MNLKITDYHRSMAARYYNRLILRFGMEATLRHVPRLALVLWTERGLKMMEEAV